MVRKGKSKKQQSTEVQGPIIALTAKFVAENAKDGYGNLRALMERTHPNKAVLPIVEFNLFVDGSRVKNLEIGYALLPHACSDVCFCNGYNPETASFHQSESSLIFMGIDPRLLVIIFKFDADPTKDIGLGFGNVKVYAVVEDGSREYYLDSLVTI